MAKYTPALSRSVLAYIKSCLETLVETDPNLTIADITHSHHNLCIFDLIEIRHLLEDECGIDFDQLTVKNVLEHWSQFFED